MVKRKKLFIDYQNGNKKRFYKKRIKLKNIKNFKTKRHNNY
jgi:hypothetical protein